MKLTDVDLRHLEGAIADAPDCPPVMSGTGGLRKIRFASAKNPGGKSGGARACYAYFAEFRLVYLCAVYAKNEKANLTAAERNEFRSIVAAFRRYLRENWKEGLTP
jgi:hypothetical protein